MRASELIGARVVDESGQRLGVVRDLRVAYTMRPAAESLPILGLVISEPGPIPAAAHAWGFAEGRARGPAPLRRILEPAAQRSVLVPVDRIRDWGPADVRVSGYYRDLTRLEEALAQ